MGLSKEELAEIYPEHPNIHLTPASPEARRLGCTCAGRTAGTQGFFVNDDCPLGHGKRGWGLGKPKPGSRYDSDLRALRKFGY